jgi:Ulp1 family protease
MVFDSLGYPHRPVGTNLKRWLLYEARDKLGQEVNGDNIVHLDVKVPQQGNYSDCGVFLIHYVKTLFKDQKHLLEFVGVSFAPLFIN